MLVTPCSNGSYQRIAARSLPTEQLVGQWQDMLLWLTNSEDEVVESKFSLEMAWFRELWYELAQREMLRVH